MPVLVHSVNVQRAPVMVSSLETAAFWVTRILMDPLEKEQLMDWVEDARAIWQERKETFCVLLD